MTDSTATQGTDEEGAPVGALLALRADPRVRGVVLEVDLRPAFDVAVAYIHWPGRPELSGIGDYLVPLLLVHFAIVGKGSATERPQPGQPFS